MKRNLVAFLPLVVWAAAVLMVGSMEDLPVPALPTHGDKLGHFIMYGVGGTLAAWAGKVRGEQAGVMALLMVIAVGGLDELNQTTVAGRHGDFWDWVADAAGATFFYLVTTALLQRN